VPSQQSYGAAWAETVLDGLGWLLAGQLRQVEWKSVTKQAGIADYRLHDNRHTHASHLVSSGVPMADGRRVRRRVIETEKGTPQGAFSPLSANIYLNHVYDQ
jgi:hypothetical protein